MKQIFLTTPSKNVKEEKSQKTDLAPKVLTKAVRNQKEANVRLGLSAI